MENNQLTLLNQEKPTLAQLCLINMPSGASLEDAQRLALKEIMNYEMILANRPELAVCTPESVVMAIKACIADNLTLAPNSGLVYLYPGKVLVKIEGTTKTYKDVLNYDPSPEGRLSIAYQAGTILDHKRPEYTFDANGQVETVSCEFLVPSHPAPRWDKVVCDRSFFAKLKAKSAAKFGNANANYSSWNGGIDPEFAFAKLIRHGLKKRGTNMNANRLPAPANIPQVIDPAKGMNEAQENAATATTNSGHEFVQFEELPNAAQETDTQPLDISGL